MAQAVGGRLLHEPAVAFALSGALPSYHSVGLTVKEVYHPAFVGAQFDSPAFFSLFFGDSVLVGGPGQAVGSLLPCHVKRVPFLHIYCLFPIQVGIDEALEGSHTAPTADPADPFPKRRFSHLAVLPINVVQDAGQEGFAFTRLVPLFFRRIFRNDYLPGKRSLVDAVIYLEKVVPCGWGGISLVAVIGLIRREGKEVEVCIYLVEQVTECLTVPLLVHHSDDRSSRIRLLLR